MLIIIPFAYNSVQWQYNFVAFFRSNIFFLVKVVANLSLHSKQWELGQDVLRYSNPDRIMTRDAEADIFCEAEV